MRNKKTSRLSAKKIVILSLVLIVFFILIDSIFYPSYLSVVQSCSPTYFEETYGDRYYVAGQTTLNESTQEVEIYLVDETDLITLKHELIHISQYNRGFPRLSCSNILSKYISEVEAYTFEKLPNRIYNWFYPGLFENS